MINMTFVLLSEHYHDIQETLFQENLMFLDCSMHNDCAFCARFSGQGVYKAIYKEKVKFQTVNNQTHWALWSGDMSC